MRNALRRIWQNLKEDLRKFKGFFMVASAMSSVKIAPAMPAKYIMQKQEEQKKQDIEEKKEKIHKHEHLYPCQKKCLPQSFSRTKSFNK